MNIYNLIHKFYINIGRLSRKLKLVDITTNAVKSIKITHVTLKKHLLLT